MIKNNENLIHHVQTIINSVCSHKIGLLPPKFGVFNQKICQNIIETFKLYI